MNDKFYDEVIYVMATLFFRDENLVESGILYLFYNFRWNYSFYKLKQLRRLKKGKLCQ